MTAIMSLQAKRAVRTSLTSMQAGILQAGILQEETTRKSG